jgi:hypothetical protein
MKEIRLTIFQFKFKVYSLLTAFEAFYEQHKFFLEMKSKNVSLIAYQHVQQVIVNLLQRRLAMKNNLELKNL